jgi:hypothetical protein
VKKHRDHLVLLQERRRVPEHLLRERQLIERGLVHHVVVGAVAVQVLHGRALQADLVDLLPGAPGALDDGAGEHVLELRAHERPALAGLHVLEVDDRHEIPVHVQRHPVAKVVARRHQSPPRLSPKPFPSM